MKEYKVPVQSLIDHIKTAIDVDPWAKEMAEELLKEQEATKPTRVNTNYEQHWNCGNCNAVISGWDKFCHECGRPVLWKGRWSGNFQNGNNHCDAFVKKGR